MDEFASIWAVINAKPTPTRVFFRDDDAGWANERLSALVERFHAFEVPLDIAVIPAALNDATAARLNDLCRDDPPTVRFHQHGYAHVSHQLNGRKSEFGSDRSASAQINDIMTGRETLLAVMAETIDPIFTPPWNRCSQATVEALNCTGFEVLSCITGAEELDTESLTALPVAVDWQKQRDGRRLSSQEFCTYAARRFADHDNVGVMLHHAVMDDAELERFSRFVEGLKQAANVEFQSMMQLARAHRG